MPGSNRTSSSHKRGRRTSKSASGKKTRRGTAKAGPERPSTSITKYRPRRVVGGRGNRYEPA